MNGQSYDISLGIDTQNVDLAIAEQGISLQVSEEIDAIEGQSYTGSYTITPTNEEQVLEIRNKVALHDITIEAIPKNYGLIGWNGAVLTVT